MSRSNGKPKSSKNRATLADQESEDIENKESLLVPTLATIFNDGKNLKLYQIFWALLPIFSKILKF